jgi:sec-independent protein translocase protein TatB
MNILGIGPAELLLIFIIALIVLGPGKLPDLARTLGKAMRELRRMSVEVTAEFAKELRDVEAISREVKETTETIKQAVDIKGTLVESAEPAPSSTGSGQGSGHRAADEAGEEPRSSDVQETPTQVKAEKKDTVGDEETSTWTATVAKENETEDHERKRTNDGP